MKKKKVIAIIITHNCAHLLESTYKRIPKKEVSKIIVSDDGSSDDLIKIAKKLKLTTFAHKHLGYGGNIKFALKKAMAMGADYMVEIHGDGQYDPATLIPALKKANEKKADLVMGSRFMSRGFAKKYKMPLGRYYANIVLTFTERLILGIPLTEFHNGFRVYSRNLIKTLGFRNTSNDYVYGFEIIAQAKYKNLKVIEVPGKFNYAKGHTSINIIKGLIYTIQTFYIMTCYLLAKIGIKIGAFKYL